MMDKQYELNLNRPNENIPRSSKVADDVLNRPKVSRQTTLTKMDLKSFFPALKKPRRSSRLIGKEVEEKKVQTVSQGPLGYFDMLPLELKFYVLGYLSIEDLSLLTITSKSMRNLTECYRVTMFNTRGLGVHSRAHGVMDVERQAEWLARYKKLGLLIKRSTCLYATKDRLKIVSDFLTRMMCRNIESCKDRTRCIGELCFGQFLHTMIAGWDDSECQRTFDCLCHHTSVFKHIKIVVSSKPGAHVGLEYEVRCFLRRVFLDPGNNTADKAFWLTRVLKPWPLVQQARLLYLLYGAAHDGAVQWYLMCSAPVDTSYLAQFFGGITCALSTLHRQSQEWTEDELISILDEMTKAVRKNAARCLNQLEMGIATSMQAVLTKSGCPEEWIGENKASLLISCGEQLTSKMLISKAINGRVTELSSIITSFCVVSVKHSYELTFVMKYVQTVLQAMENTRDRLSFVNSLMDMFKELVFDLHDYSDTDDEGDDRDLFYLVTAFAEFSKKVIHLAFKQLL